MAKETTQRKVVRYKKVGREHFLVVSYIHGTRTFGNRRDARREYLAELHRLVKAGICDQKGWAVR